MSCRSCGSNRIAFLQAHSKDLSFLEVEHLSLEHDGYFPDIPGVCSGDDADFEFCLGCGMIQSDTFPITDETIKEAFAPDEGFVDYEDDEENDEEDDEDYWVALRLDDGSMDECKVQHCGLFLQLPWVEAIKAKPDFYSWAVTTDPTNGKILVAVFYPESVGGIVLEKVAVVPQNSFNYDSIAWDIATKHFKS